MTWVSHQAPPVPGVPYLVSFDGRCGDRAYGEPLPRALRLRRVPLAAGRSAQAVT